MDDTGSSGSTLLTGRLHDTGHATQLQEMGGNKMTRPARSRERRVNTVSTISKAKTIIVLIPIIIGTNTPPDGN